MKTHSVFLSIAIVICMIASCDILEFMGTSDAENAEQQENPDVELPLYCDVSTIDGWTNTRFCKNGLTIFTQNYEGTSDVQKTLMFVPVDSLGIISIYGEFDENGYPQYLAFNDVVAFIDNYTENTFDATLIRSGQVLWTATDLAFDGLVNTKAWNENNWVRNVTAIGGVITSGVGIGVGVALTGTGVGAAAGVLTVGLSSMSLVSNLEVLFGPGESYAENEYIQNQLEGIGMNSLIDALAKDKDSYLEKIFKNTGYFNQSYDVPNLFWAELSIGLVDLIWGETVTESQRQMAYALAHRSYQVATGRVGQVSKHSAELWGYITPEAITPLNKFAEVEYGIVVYKKDNPSERRTIEDIGGNGGPFSLQFNGLDANAEYCYLVYYYDKTNACYRQGETRTFITRGSNYLTLDSISCDYDDCYYYTEGDAGMVAYNLTAEISGDTDEIGEYQSCGIYLTNNDTGKSYILYEGLSGYYDETEIELSLGFSTSNFEVMDYAEYYAESSKYSFGIFIKFNDGTNYMSEDKSCKFIYDKKPYFRYTSVSPMSVSVAGSEVNEAGETIIMYNAEHTYSYVCDGVLWMNSIQRWCDGGIWRFEDTGEQYSEPWTPNADYDDDVTVAYHYWSSTEMYHSVWNVITTKSGVSLYSNSLIYSGTPENPTVSIGATKTYISAMASYSDESRLQLDGNAENGSVRIKLLEDNHAVMEKVQIIDRLEVLNHNN